METSPILSLWWVYIPRRNISLKRSKGACSKRFWILGRAHFDSLAIFFWSLTHRSQFSLKYVFFSPADLQRVLFSFLKGFLSYFSAPKCEKGRVKLFNVTICFLVNDYRGMMPMHSNFPKETESRKRTFPQTLSRGKKTVWSQLEWVLGFRKSREYSWWGYLDPTVRLGRND